MTQDSNRDTSIVGNCDATDCRYNENRECHAGQIQVSMSGNMAQCATYTPRSEQGGMHDTLRDNPA